MSIIFLDLREDPVNTILRFLDKLKIEARSGLEPMRK